jgi:SAM-dependent methyltransferase
MGWSRDPIRTSSRLRPHRGCVDREYVAAVAANSGTWHHGLVARWWGEFTEAEPEELAYFRAAIKRFGEPVLDAGCGNGRILLPLLADGFDMDGSDISADMIALAEAQALKAGFKPRLVVQPMHELELGRKYRTIYMCGAFGIGSTRDNDREALRRAYRHLEPGGALLIANHELPYATSDARWAQWIPGARDGLTREWQTEGEKRITSDGDEIEWLGRPAELDPLEQRVTMDVRIRLRHGGEIVKEEAYSLRENLYFAQEILLLLDEAGFRDVAVEGGYTGKPATPDDGMVVFTALK